MALSFFIQEGVVSTGKKTVGSLAQLFDVTRWLKFALRSLGVAYFDPCDTNSTELHVLLLLMLQQFHLGLLLQDQLFLQE